MVLTPEPMQRALIVSSKGHQAQVIETLHKLRVAHFIDYHEQGGEFAEFKLGAPLALALRALPSRLSSGIRPSSRWPCGSPASGW